MSLEKKIFLLLFCIFFNTNFYSQSLPKKVIGAIYFTYKDYLKGHQSLITYKGETFVPYTYSKIIKIKNKDTTARIEPGKVFAYFDGKNTYRYWSSSENILYTGYFKIVSVGQMIIYEKLVYHKTMPGMRDSKIKGLKLHSFYSVNIDSPIRELLYTNLVIDYKDEPFLLAEINKIQNSCKECVGKKKKGGYQISKAIEKLVKEHPDQVKRAILRF